MRRFLKDWPEYVLFFVGVGGAVVLLIGPWFGLQISKNPMAYTGVGAILTYVLTQGRVLKRHADQESKSTKDESEEANGGLD